MRWELADDPDAPATLFEYPVFEREPGRGEFRGMEFLHVRARTIINELKGAPAYLPFRFTINAYRGCSHACSYCLAGDTPILMADGRTKPLVDARKGDIVVGTVGRGRNRRYAPSEVLDHWQTIKAAWRVTLADGSSVVASADHRFLTESGWRPVAELDGESCGFRNADRRVRVVAVEPLGVEMPMYDITTGTGDFIANGVVSHNCFARPTHAYLDLDTGRDFETRIVVKVNAVERLRIELDPRRWRGDHIAMGTNTDPYQRCEGKYRLTRGIIEVLTEAANPFSILTKSTLILRDLDLLRAAAERTDVSVNLSIGTLDERVWRSTEPGTPHPRQRVEAVRKLNAAGIRTGVLVAPILPGLSDGADQIDDVVGACLEAGAASVSSVLLHLRPGVKEVMYDALAISNPPLRERYQALYGDKSYAPAADRQRVARLVRMAVRRHGGERLRPFSDQVVNAPARRARSAPPGQMSLL